MDYELKAEYDFLGVLAWHIVPEGTAATLCGQPVAPAAEVLPILRLDDVDSVCSSCEIDYAFPGSARPTRA
ncbi:hypothetical protein [Streptacidiphilus rugosus]|uniref:hypothetical protein n=1 Tax=Streptacidiphilus rugosus TaxID=405783 RepID=UPI000564A8DD|nr:hypothetical protein [Streptacidiphilus rugosus]